MSAQLEVRDVSRQFGLPDGRQLHVLRQVNLQLQPGEIVAIIGRSGSGKSTLLTILGLLDVPTSGSVFYAGQDVSSLSDARRCRIRGEHIGFVFQQFHLLDRKTALENVAEPLFYGDREHLSRRHEIAMEMLDSVGLDNRAGNRPNTLSGGEQQRVAIARALVRRPNVVLADEPTGSLDEQTGALVLDLLVERVRSLDTALVLVTHDRTVAALADRVLELREGILRSDAE